eukprot:1435311-Amphidinium_carterae.1
MPSPIDTILVAISTFVILVVELKLFDQLQSVTVHKYCKIKPAKSFWQANPIRMFFVATTTTTTTTTTRTTTTTTTRT